VKRNASAAIAGALVTIAIPYGWIIAASAIYCAGAGRSDLFVWPFTQWLDVLPDWRANWWVSLWVFIGAVVPTIGIGLAAAATTLILKRTRQRAQVYGKTDWASRRQMDKANISTSRTPF
jgi:hypothetical protein